MNPQEIQTVLVYTGMELLGDGIMKVPFIRAIRQAFPNARITWMTGHGSTSLKSSLYALIKDDIAEIIESSHIGYSWHQLFGLPEAWQKRSYDLILDTQGKKMRSLILRKIPHRYFISRSWNWRLSDFKPPRGYKHSPHLVDRLIEYINFATGSKPTPDCHINIPQNYLLEALRLLPEGGKYLGLSPGAGQDKKCWPLNHYIEVGQFFISQDFIPTFILGPREVQWQEQIAKALPQALFPLQNTAEKSPFLTMALARRMNMILANDSGVGHLLAVGERPIITLFGPTDPKRYAPQTPYGQVITSQEVGKGRDISKIPVSYVTAALSTIV